MERLQEKIILKDLKQKMVFLSGPRQAGKTTLANNLIKAAKNGQYLNFDNLTDKPVMIKAQWNRQSDLVVLDEIHKWRPWKNSLKGIYDKEGNSPALLVTGSARMDVFRRGGDSLAGRYFMHRLYPFSAAELKNHYSPSQALEKLMVLGGFPEPFLSGSEVKAKRWRKNYLDRVLREDVRDFTALRDINALLYLVEMLRERVGSPIFYSSLAEDLQISPITVKNWIDVLEKLYIVFKVVPYHRNIARAIKKEPKIYFYDCGLVRGDKGAVFENLTAFSLLKHLHYLEDTQGIETKLCYLRDKEKREVDFMLIQDGVVTHLIETKYADENLQRPLIYFRERFAKAETIQLVYNLKQTKTVAGIQIEPVTWLSGLST